MKEKLMFAGTIQLSRYTSWFHLMLQINEKSRIVSLNQLRVNNIQCVAGIFINSLRLCIKKNDTTLFSVFIKTYLSLSKFGLLVARPKIRTETDRQTDRDRDTATDTDRQRQTDRKTRTHIYARTHALSLSLSPSLFPAKPSRPSVPLPPFHVPPPLHLPIPFSPSPLSAHVCNHR